MKSIGEFLREKRAEKGIEDEYFKAGHVLNMRIVKALEGDNYAFFKGYFYFINFLKDYLKMLGLDVEQFISDFSEELDLIKMNNFKSGVYFPGMRYSKFKKRSIFLKVVLALIILLSVFVIFNRDFIYKEFPSWKNVKPLKTPETFSGYFKNRTVYSDFSFIDLTLSFLGDCWVRIVKGGEILTERVFRKNENYKVEGYNIILFLGDPTVVKIVINGKIIDKFSRRSGFTKIELNTDTLESILKWKK